MDRNRKGVAETGRVVGESHHRSTIPDQIVDTVRELHEECGRSYQWIAIRLSLRLPTVAKLCRYERRVPHAVRWRTVRG